MLYKSGSHEDPATSPSNLFEKRGLGRLNGPFGCVVGNPGQVLPSFFNAFEVHENTAPLGWIDVP